MKEKITFHSEQWQQIFTLQYFSPLIWSTQKFHTHKSGLMTLLLLLYYRHPKIPNIRTDLTQKPSCVPHRVGNHRNLESITEAWGHFSVWLWFSFKESRYWLVKYQKAKLWHTAIFAKDPFSYINPFDLYFYGNRAQKSGNNWIDRF